MDEGERMSTARQEEELLMRGYGIYLTRIMNSTSRTLEVALIAVHRIAPTKKR